MDLPHQLHHQEEHIYDLLLTKTDGYIDDHIKMC